MRLRNKVVPSEKPKNKVKIIVRMNVVIISLMINPFSTVTAIPPHKSFFVSMLFPPSNDAWFLLAKI